jgi:hypothetical protein
VVILIDLHFLCRLRFQQHGSFSLQYRLFWYVILKTLLLLYMLCSLLFASYVFDVQCGILKAFKRAAESLEKLMDVTREELPDTMAAVRLSGMEISDLTMELSDLGLAS